MFTWWQTQRVGSLIEKAQTSTQYFNTYKQYLCEYLQNNKIIFQIMFWSVSVYKAEAILNEYIYMP